MAECDWIILCDYAFPAMHGKLGLIGVFDTIYAKALPVTHHRAAIGFAIIGEPGERVQPKIEIISPTGKVLATAALGPLVLPNQGGAFAHVDVAGLKMADWGRHAIQIDLGDGDQKSAWFTLRKIEG
jgi:hypothetical protein